jgi:hypothetical protein
MPRETVAAPDCATLALYGVDSGAEAAERFYHSALSWFRACGHAPDRVSVYGPGFAGKWGGLSRADGRLRRRGFQGVTAIALVAMQPGGEIPLVDWLLSANWSVKHDYAMVAAQGSVVPFKSEGFRRIAEEMVRVLKPGYGIGYHMPHRLGPDMYAVGVQRRDPEEVLTGEAYEESLNTARWLDMGMRLCVWRAGVLRDVYPWNFLTAPQLEAKVGRRTLRSWIRQDAQRGSLTAVTDAVVLWEVPEEAIPGVRSQLKAAHLLFDRRRFVKKEKGGEGDAGDEKGGLPHEKWTRG